MNENELEKVTEKSLDDLKRAVAAAYKSFERVSKIVENIEKEKKKVIYKSMPGVSGTFDGVNLICEDGSKLEVPANYAAKSRLVFGDTLKVIEENGTKLFKQIDKAERKKIEGVISKKEGHWYVLAGDGSYRISDIAAEFNRAELNDKAIAYIPEGNPNSPYAALDKVIKPGQPSVATDSTNAPAAVKPIVKFPEKKPVVQKEAVSPVASPASPAVPATPATSTSTVSKTVSTKPFLPPRKPAKPKEATIRAEAPKESPKETPKPVSKEFVANILEDDDLR